MKFVTTHLSKSKLSENISSHSISNSSLEEERLKKFFELLIDIDKSLKQTNESNK